MRYLFLLFSIITLSILSFIPAIDRTEFEYPETLSTYGFFEGELHDLSPSGRVIPYDLNTPLFTDYALKARFIYLPEGKDKIEFDDIDPFRFPVGTILIKNFYYPGDFRKPEKNIRILETRLLIHEESGWVALPYLWNEEQNEAFLEVAGGNVAISWKDEKGKKRATNYSIPNMNQCKGCHNRNNNLLPIGPTARQLNRDFNYSEGKINQLEYLQSKEWIELPEDQTIPRAAVWNDEQSGSLDERARMYLDINCAHCHSPEGAANTTGLFLNVYQNDNTAYGIFKTPVAAGRGSGGHLYDIVPGKPSESILIFRMESTDPGIAMPEIGRTMVHKEGVQLIQSWIKDLENNE